MKWLLFAIAMVAAPAFAQGVRCPYTVEQSLQHFVERFGDKRTLAEWSKLEQLDFGQLGMVDEDVPYLCPLTELKSLSIYNDKPEVAKLKGKTLSYIAMLPNLIYLDLDGNEITGRELVGLKGAKKLKTLKLGMGNPVGSEGMVALDLLPSLDTLILQADKLRPEDLNWLSESNKNWKYIYLGDNPDLGNASLLKLRNIHVEEIGLANVGLKDESNFEAIAANPNIKSISFNGVSLEKVRVILDKLSSSNSLEELDVLLPLTEEFGRIVAGTRLRSVYLAPDEDLPSSTENMKALESFISGSQINKVKLLVAPMVLFKKADSVCSALKSRIKNVLFTLSSGINDLPCDE